MSHPRKDDSFLCIVRTRVFSVIGGSADCIQPESPTRSLTKKCVDGDDSSADATPQPSSVPVLSLVDLLLHENRGITRKVQRQLHRSLADVGYCFLTSPVDRHDDRSKRNRASRILRQLRESAASTIFPDGGVAPEAHCLTTSDVVYVSERGVPMYRLGYELCEDGVRQVFRVAGGCPDAVAWPTPDDRALWLQGLGLCRHVCDAALDLLLQSPCETEGDGATDGVVATASPESSWWASRGSKRPGSGSRSWNRDSKGRSNPSISPERSGDFSVLYIMHYFNRGAFVDCDEGQEVAVKPHVDPSLLVLEPFLCKHTTGLQVWDRRESKWLGCDGPNSPVAHLWHDHEVLLLFAGRALASACGMEPTLHRVVGGDEPRRAVIYEQKYEEFFPPPALD